MEQYLRKLYYGLGSPVSYTGFSALWRKIKNDGEQKEISRADLMKWLSEQYVYSLHMPYHRRYMHVLIEDYIERRLALFPSVHF